ncbi:YqgQ family protein [Bacillus sp. FJAT-50079]|uniref:YqgQ family protein n=1 Tax=Bacillus sp. FJAT-50079 TaxID=2833577 RepID=UPI001BC9BC49|nr:YqgQ family protein [Bacillus sp. FJAT-50079]MBS4209600.1 YqgQ family protein [Bacillus sp. FJAT-50079]
MKSAFDVQQLLKNFGIFIYIGDRLADLELMEAEVRELYGSKLITSEQFQQALLILRSEITKEKNKK